MITIDQAVEFMNKNYGDDIEILEVNTKKDYINIVWCEVGDKDKYFSNIGKGRYGRIVELSGGDDE